MYTNISIFCFAILGMAITKKRLYIYTLAPYHQAGIYFYTSQNITAISLLGYILKIIIMKKYLSIFILGLNIIIRLDKKQIEIRNLFFNKIDFSSYYILGLSVYAYKGQFALSLKDDFGEFTIIDISI